MFLFDHVVNKFLGWYQRVFSGEEMVIMSTQCVLTPNRPSVGPGPAPRKASADLMIMIGPAALVLVFFIAALSCASYLFQENRFGMGASFILAKNDVLLTASELSALPQTIDHQIAMQFIQRQPLITFGLMCGPDFLLSCSTPAIPAQRVWRAARWRSTRSPPGHVMSCRTRAGQVGDGVPLWIQPCPR